MAKRKTELGLGRGLNALLGDPELSAQGDGAYLEDQVRTLERLGRDRGVFGRVLIVDCGLTEEGRRLARLLAREDRGVGLCGPDEVERYLIQ